MDMVWCRVFRIYRVQEKVEAAQTLLPKRCQALFDFLPPPPPPHGAPELAGFTSLGQDDGPGYLYNAVKFFSGSGLGFGLISQALHCFSQEPHQTERSSAASFSCFSDGYDGTSHNRLALRGSYRCKCVHHPVYVDTH